MLVTDTSGSMNATDVEPSRLDAAKDAADRFLDNVPDELRVGLVAFSDAPGTVLRPTEEREPVRSAVDGLAAEGGTATGDALDSALRALGTRAEDAPPAAVVLLSDGATQSGRDPVAVAREAADAGVPVYTVALGTPDGVVEANGQVLRVPPDPEALAEVARASGGAAFAAEDAGALDEVYERLGSQIGTREEQREISAGFAAAGLLLLGRRWADRCAGAAGCRSAAHGSRVRPSPWVGGGLLCASAWVWSPVAWRCWSPRQRPRRRAASRSSARCSPSWAAPATGSPSARRRSSPPSPARRASGGAPSTCPPACTSTRSPSTAAGTRTTAPAARPAARTSRSPHPAARSPSPTTTPRTCRPTTPPRTSRPSAARTGCARARWRGRSRPGRRATGSTTRPRAAWPSSTAGSAGPPSRSRSIPPVCPRTSAPRFPTSPLPPP